MAVAGIEARTVAERVGHALESDIPRIYFNGFVGAFSAGDIMFVLERNGQQVGIMNMSYTVAKTLSSALSQLVDQLEQTSGQPIMTTQEVGKLLEKSSGDPKKKSKRPRTKKGKSN